MTMQASPSASEGSKSHDPCLAALAAEYWEGRLAADPIEATLLGDHRWSAALPDPTPAANHARIAVLEVLANRVRAIDAAALLGNDRVTHAALVGEIDNDIAGRRCAIAEWAIDPRDGIHVTVQNLAQLTPITTVESGRAFVARWEKLGAHIDARIANLRASAKAGRIATRGSVVRVLAQLDELLAEPAAMSALLAPVRAEHPDWPGAALAQFRAGVSAALDGGIRPALVRYAQVARDEILPGARDDAHVGLTEIPDGAACYARLIHVHTSLDIDAKEIHRIGLEEIARIRAEMSALGEKLFGTRDLAAIQARLRSDPSLYFDTREAVERQAEEALRRAEVAMPRWFGRIAKTPCEVVRVAAFEEKDTTIAYYRQPAVDGSRPYFQGTTRRTGAPF